MVIQSEILKGIPGSTFLIAGRIIIHCEIIKEIPRSTFLIAGRILIQSEIIKGISRSTFTVLKKNPKVHRRKENPRFHTVNASVSESERSAVVKTNSVFYSVLVVM